MGGSDSPGRCPGGCGYVADVKALAGAAGPCITLVMPILIRRSWRSA